MSERRQRIWAPILILVALVILWEGLVTAFNIQQFLLPKPSAIIGNLVQVLVLDGSATAGDAGAEVSLKNRFLVFLPDGLSPEQQSALRWPAQWLDISSAAAAFLSYYGAATSQTISVAASWFTLKEGAWEGWPWERWHGNRGLRLLQPAGAACGHGEALLPFRASLPTLCLSSCVSAPIMNHCSASIKPCFQNGDS